MIDAIHEKVYIKDREREKRKTLKGARIYYDTITAN